MGLDADDLVAFERAASDLAAAVAASPEETRQLVGAGYAILSSSSLSLDEVTRRAGRIVAELPPTVPVFRGVAEAARSSSPAIRAGVISELPPEWHRASYLSDSAAGTSQTGEGGGRTLGPRNEAGSTDSYLGSDLRTVWLLGASDEVEPNHRFLEGRQFDPIRVSTLDQLPVIERESCCGVAVHQGWWDQFNGDAEAIAEFVRARLKRATIPYYRIDTSGLDDEAATLLTSVLDEHDPGTQSRVQLGEGCVLNAVDAQKLSEVASLLASADEASVALEGLTDDERRLLASAIALFEAEERGGSAPAGELVMLPLLQGQSDARVFRVRSADRRAVYVAKLDTIDHLRDEHDRARGVAPESQAVRMAFYSLGGSAVLLQRLTAALDRPLEGAPTLKERLQVRSAWERGPQDDAGPRLDDLAVGIDRTIALIHEVRQPATGEYGCNCWVKCEPLTHLARVGVTWAIPGANGKFDPAGLVPWVERKVAQYGTASMVHGDVHAGNVLMLDDRTPHLIDFALAGHGHPCFDHVRLASAVAFTCLRPTQPEDRLRQFLEAVHLEGEDRAMLEERFQDVLGNSGAVLAAHVLAGCRSSAMDGVGDTDDAVSQYLAMVYLIAAQSLTMDDFQNAVVRATLGALQPRIEEMRASEPLDGGA